MKLSHVRRCKVLAANAAGRDFVVGDLHGQIGALEADLERRGFDPRRDRVISVGDLINRGPRSLDTLGLIEQPWFHAVLGNHELLMLGFLGFFDSRQHDRHAFAVRKGAWLVEAVRTHRRRVMQLAEQVAQMPLVLQVGDAMPFNVTHGDLLYPGHRRERLARGELLDIHDAEAITTSRAHLDEALAADLQVLAFGEQPVGVSSTPKAQAALTYVGHSPMPRITVHNSYVYVDQGVRGGQRRMTACGPTMLEHRCFSLWLDGVAAAHRSTARMLKPLGRASTRLAA